MIARIRPAFFLLLLLSSQTGLRAGQQQESLAQEEKTDYYDRWIDQDVVYIISPKEKQIFKELVTDEEKDSFIEQFWHRRNPDLRTSVNEFKEEHYRRIAYANEHFKSGFQGWKTDRGRIYIIWGPPDEKEAYPTGGNYERRSYEGGGFTNVYPFERWWYRDLEGIGSDIELEFVDPLMANEYYLAVNSEEKDALLYVPGGGPTWAEDFGYKDKKDRPYFVSNIGDPYPWINNRAKDDPMRRYEQWFEVQRPAPVKFKDLKQFVEVNLTFDEFPFEVRQDYLKVNEAQVLAPITLQFSNKDLTFKESNGAHSIRLAVYGIVTSLTNRILTEFEDEVGAQYRPEELQQGLLERSMYQKIISLDAKMRYKIDLVVKDLNSGKIGVLRRALVPPRFSQDKLEASSLILSGFIQQLDQIPDKEQMFVLGDMRIRPSVDKSFLSSDPLGIYVQLYNVRLEQSTFEPSLQVRYRIMKNGEPVREVLDKNGESTQFFSGQRLILIKGLSLQGLDPGPFALELTADDQISGQSLTLSTNFTVEGLKTLASSN